MIRRVELQDFQLQILGVCDSSSAFPDEADGDVSGFEPGSRDRMCGIVADAGEKKGTIPFNASPRRAELAKRNPPQQQQGTDHGF